MKPFRNRPFVRKSRQTIGRSVEDNRFLKWRLSNGLTVVANPIEHLQSVSLGIWVLTGSRCETPETAGLSHFVEHTVFKGTRRRTSRQIANSLEYVGGSLNAFTSKEHTCYYASILSSQLDLTVDVLADLVFSATLRPGDVEKERQVILEEIRDTEDNPEEFVQDKLYGQLFRSHALGFPILGTPETVQTLKTRQLEDYYRGNYQPSNMILSVAGQFDVDELERSVTAWLQGHRKTGLSTPWTKRFRPVNLKMKTGRREVVQRNSSQSHLCYGLRLPIGYRDMKKFDALAYNMILGGGMSSRLFQGVREQSGLTYSIYSFIDFLLDVGVLGIYFATDRNRLEKAESMTRKEISRLADHGPRGSELKMAKAQMKANLLFGLESTSTQMVRLAKNEIYFKKNVDMSVLTDYIESISLSDVRNIAEYVAANQDATEVTVLM